MSDERDVSQPPAEAVSTLDRILGKDAYAIEYRGEKEGGLVVVRTTEQTPRAWTTRIGPGELHPVQLAAIWQEFTSRIEGTPHGERHKS